MPKALFTIPWVGLWGHAAKEGGVSGQHHWTAHGDTSEGPLDANTAGASAGVAGGGSVSWAVLPPRGAARHLYQGHQLPG